MDKKNKKNTVVNFRKYNIKISRREINELSDEELEKCKKQINEIKEIIER